MSSFNLFTLFMAFVVLVFAIFAGQAEAAMCDCNFNEKGAEVCGSNGITYINRCEFQCTQRDYMKLRRTLRVAKQGPC